MSDATPEPAPTPFTLVGGDAPVCVDGVCEIPGVESEPVDGGVSDEPEAASGR